MKYELYYKNMKIAITTATNLKQAFRVFKEKFDYNKNWRIKVTK